MSSQDTPAEVAARFRMDTGANHAVQRHRHDGGVGPVSSRKASEGGITVGYRILLVLADVNRATVAKLVEDTDACNRSSVRYHLLRMIDAGLVEEAGLIAAVGCVQKVMTYRLSRRLRGGA